MLTDDRISGSIRIWIRYSRNIDHIAHCDHLINIASPDFRFVNTSSLL